MINVQDKLFQDVLSEIAHFKVVKIEVKTKDGKVVEKTERLWVLKEEMYTHRAGRLLYKFLNSEIVFYAHFSFTTSLVIFKVLPFVSGGKANVTKKPATYRHPTM